MAVTVKIKYLRHSAKKLRPVLSLFRGQNLEQAINRTGVMSQDSARYLHQALKSARAAAEAKEFDPSELEISELFAVEGPKIKRVRPNSRGRSNKFLKYLAHLTVTVGPAKERIKKKTTTKEVEAKPVVQAPKASSRVTTTVKEKGK